MTASRVTAFLEQFHGWASAQPSIWAVALVGSHARGSANAESDIDLVILAEDPHRYLADRAWVMAFGTPVLEAVEDHGNVRSIRVGYQDGLEVEFGLTHLEWARVPLDPGTQEVCDGGMRVILERGSLLSRLLR